MDVPVAVHPIAETAVLPEAAMPSRGGTGLPPELLRKSVHRLGTVALLYAFAYTILHGISLVVEPDTAGRPASWAAYGIALVSSTLMFALARSRRIRAERVLNLGLVYLVVGALGIVLDDFSRPGPAELGMGEITWLCVWILGFPLIVASHPRKTLVAALAAATMMPVSLALAVLFGGTSLPDWHLVLRLFLPNYLCVVLAVLGSRVVYGLGTDVARARLMGSYHLEKRLGSGGMGEVWLARHAMLAFPAAIKLMRPDLLQAAGEGGGALRERFTREAQATAGLRSPHSIRLFDFGVTEAGAFYYVMELLRGLDLRTLVESYGPVPPERAAAILGQVCHALADAHQLGLIHRDVKPANVYLCRMGLDYDFVKVLDFGLVARRSMGDELSDLTSPHMPVPGTPAFMSPEMILRDHEVDGRADLYAVGCLAYWLVAGTYPFTGATVMQVLHHHVNSVPVPLSRLAECDVPSAFEALVLACLAKRPEDRPPSAEALAQELARCRFDAAWTPERARDWWDAHLPQVQASPAGQDPETVGVTRA